MPLNTETIPLDDSSCSWSIWKYVSSKQSTSLHNLQTPPLKKKPTYLKIMKSNNFFAQEKDIPWIEGFVLSRDLHRLVAAVCTV